MKVGINQLIAPIKLMILIKPDDKDRFSRAMQLASCCWGGMHVPIFPFYEELPRDYREEYCITIPAASYYKNLLSNYDPDVLVYDEDLSVDLIKTIGEGLKAVTVESLMEELKEARNDHSIGIYEVAIYLRENEFKFTRADGMQFALPKFKENCLLLDAMFCRLPDDENERLKLIFKGNSAFIEPILDWENAETYRNLSVIDPLMTISYQLRPYGNLRQEFGSAYYPMRRNRLRDVMNYWNLRASGWHILPIALDLLDANYFYQATKRFISRRQSSYGAESMFFINILAAKSISERLSRMVFQNLAGDNLANNKRLMYSYQPWFPRYWSEYETLKADHVKAVLVIKDSHFDHYDSEDAYLRIPIKPMNLQWEGNVSRNTSYKIILQWDLYDEQAEYAELLSGISQKQFIRLVSPMDFRNTRLSPAGIHKPVRQGDRDITLVVPKAEPFFRAYFSTLNHNLVETSNSKLASEVLRNIGGIMGAKFFLRLGTLKIIELFEGGKIIAYSTLIAEIKKNGKLENISEQNLISRMLEHKIIEIGAEIQCTVCNQRGFHLPSQIGLELACPVCRNSFSLPQSDPAKIIWSYRGIGPFTRNNKADGVMAVFATLGLFTEEFSGMDSQLSSLIGFELNRSGSKNKEIKEVDLGILMNNQYDPLKLPDLLLCECKTYKRFVQKDIDRMITLGESFPGAVLTFATLNETLDETEVDLIGKLVQHFQTGSLPRPTNPVLILTGRELLPDSYYGNLDSYTEEIKPFHRYNDYLGSLCELTIQRNLKVENWWALKDRIWSEKHQRRTMVSHIIQALLERPTALLLLAPGPIEKTPL